MNITCAIKAILGITLIYTHLVFAETSTVNSDSKQASIKTTVQEKANEDTVEKIDVFGVRRRLTDAGYLKDNIAKTELLTDDYIQNTQAASLADAIQNAIGIRVSNECSMCGAKRIMINGMKGEHTNVLIDGIPMHTMISGFYGMDSVAASGIGTIEIARGAGASLTAPEAIGGTVNMLTKSANRNGIEVDLSTGELGYKKASLVATGVSDDANTNITLVAQYDHKEQFDGDDNGVSENPALTNQSATIYFSHDLDYSNNLRVRYNQSNSEVFGGPVLGDTTESVADALSSVAYGNSSQFFEGDDVRNKFIGLPWETTEWVKTDREEFSLSWLHELSGDINITSSIAYIDHLQDSFYEGVDYRADDTMAYLNVRINHDINENHLLTYGLDYRNEEMRSHSRALSNLENYVSDSFDYITTGLFIQDSWIPSDNFELAAALRIDKIEADFVDPSKPGIEIDKTLFSPRVDMRYLHSDRLTSRLSLGQGYRAPLSFFESDHGILDAGKGYRVEVDQPERSDSINYSLNFDGEKLSSTFSIAFTKIEHMASLSHDDHGTPVLGQLSETANVVAVDLALNYQLFDELSLSLTAEEYRYNNKFKESFAIAPVEQRMTFSSDWDYKGWDVIASTTWVASRDLSEYAYHGYNVNNATGLKSTNVPSYVTVDLKVIKALSKHLKIYLGANNLFNYNQAKDMDSPLMFDENGNYDVVYIHGPLRGRSAYLGLRYEL